MVQAVRLIISGRVQGVFFRAYTKEVADSLGLKGFVRNLKDGSVEVIAVGDEDRIKKFIAWCKKGPRNAKVEDVKIKYTEIKEDFKEFEIRY